jgi:hypothetical protein
VPFGEGTRDVFKLRRHGVVPAVEEAEQRAHRDQLHDLRLVEVPAQRLEVPRLDQVRYQSRAARQAQRGTLGVREDGMRLELEGVLDLLDLDARVRGVRRGVRLAVATAGRVASDVSHQLLQPGVDRARAVDGAGEQHKRLENLRAVGHREQAVGDESSHHLLGHLKERLVLFEGLSGDRSYMGHRSSIRARAVVRRIRRELR